MSRSNEELREEYLKEKREKLKNVDFSILASNCIGTFISHDLKLQYKSPTVNLYFSCEDFIRFVENLQHYLSLELVEVINEKYPIGILGDVKIKFLHYKSFEEAKRKWIERKERLNIENIFILACEKDGCNYSLLQRFDKLPYKNKIMLTHKNYPEFKSTYYIKGFEDKGELGFIFEFTNESGKVYYDDFDYVKWLNGEISQE